MEVPAQTIIAVKLASGAVFFELLIGVGTGGTVVAQWSMPAADVTSLNTNVNGGATDATRTFSYGQTDSGSLKGKVNHWSHSY